MKRFALLILLLAFVLRMVHLQSRPLWYDEAFTVLYSSKSPARMLRGTVTAVPSAGAADVHPLLYYFLLHAWMRLVGQSPLAVRFLSVVLGMITIGLLWRLASWFFGSRTGTAAGLLAAVNPFHVAYSQEARMYALLALGAIISTWALLRAVGRGSRRRETSDGSAFLPHAWWAVYVIGATLTLYAHNLGAFVMVALHVLILIHRRLWRHLSSLALADMAVLILVGPWLLGVLPGQIGFVSRGYWLSPPGIEEVVRVLMLPVLTFYEPTPFWLLGIGLFTSILLLALMLPQVLRLKSQVSWFMLLCWMPILLLFLVSLWRPLYLERGLLPSALFYVVGIAWLLTRGALPPFFRGGLAALLTLSICGALTIHYSYEAFPRPPFQAAVEFLEGHVGSDDAVIHTNKLTYFPMHVYNPDLSGAFLADPPGSPQDTLAQPTQEALGIFATTTVTGAVGGASRAWLVYFPREVKEARMITGEHAAFRWMEEQFFEVRREQFSDLTIALYRRKSRENSGMTSPYLCFAPACGARGATAFQLSARGFR